MTEAADPLCAVPARGLRQCRLETAARRRPLCPIRGRGRPHRHRPLEPRVRGEPRVSGSMPGRGRRHAAGVEVQGAPVDGMDLHAVGLRPRHAAAVVAAVLAAATDAPSEVQRRAVDDGRDARGRRAVDLESLWEEGGGQRRENRREQRHAEHGRYPVPSCPRSRLTCRQRPTSGPAPVPLRGGRHRPRPATQCRRPPLETQSTSQPFGPVPI